MQLAAEVARQLLPLIEERVVQAGQVIYDVQGIVFRIVGVHHDDTDDDVASRKKVRDSCQPAMVFQLVAQRYNLVRHPVRASDPPPPAHPGGRTRSWEISPAAQLLAPVVAEELATERLRL
ncbi:hypothetical protein ACIA9I_38185 [Streptomyces anulatus]